MKKIITTNKGNSEHKNQRLSAFSLIELSIVILIIGIIIAGVTQGSRLVRQFKLSSAKTLTNSSPVASVKGLVMWLEPTLDDSIPEAQAEEGVAVTQWNTTNPQSSDRYYAANADTETSPTYSDKGGPNGLPSLLFDGTQFLNLASDAGGLIPVAFSTDQSAFTFFFVSQPTAVPGGGITRFVFENGTGSWQYYEAVNVYGITGPAAGAWDGNRDMTTAPRVIAGSYNGSVVRAFYNGVNDSNDTPVASIPAPAAGTSFRIGVNAAEEHVMLSYISEIIVFDRALKTEERQSIEDYLGKKYAIKITH